MYCDMTETKTNMYASVWEQFLEKVLCPTLKLYTNMEKTDHHNSHLGDS